jgi:hypothetical protein
MAFTLEDLLALPDEVQPEHAVKAGLTVPPPPAPAPGPQPPAPIATAAPAPAAPGPPAPIIPIDGNKFFGGLKEHPHTLPQEPAVAPNIDAMPGGVGPNAGLGSVDATNAYTTLPKLNFKQREALPTTSPGVASGTSQYEQNLLDREQEKDKNPWGSAENHPGWLGKVAHGLAKAGNIAGNVLDPAAMALIPETELGHRVQENQLFNKTQKLKESELGQQAEQVKEQQEATKEEHEQNYREHQLALEKETDEKIAQIMRGNDIKGEKVSSDTQKWMRDHGVMPDPNNPGKIIDIPEDQLSPQELNKQHLGQALIHAREARAAYDEYRADPTRPEAQAALQRAQAARTLAGAAATRAGVDVDKFLAQFLGVDKEGNPIAGVQQDENGKPIGTEVTKSNASGKGKVEQDWEKNYNKPANDVERAYQMYQEALDEYNRGDAKTGAATMLALSQHLNTTFGQVKGSRLNRDLIQEHKDAIGALDRLELEAGKLVGRGDQLTADQMVEFGRLIQHMRDLTWQTATKEALRHDLPVDFLPQDEAALAKMPKPADLRKPNAAKPNAGGGAATPTPKQGGQTFGPAPPGSKENRTGMQGKIPVMIYKGQIVERNP